jgi:hypothetical protein
MIGVQHAPISAEHVNQLVSQLEQIGVKQLEQFGVRSAILNQASKIFGPEESKQVSLGFRLWISGVQDKYCLFLSALVSANRFLCFRFILIVLHNTNRYVMRP